MYMGPYLREQAVRRNINVYFYNPPRSRTICFKINAIFMSFAKGISYLRTSFGMALFETKLNSNYYTKFKAFHIVALCSQFLI